MVKARCSELFRAYSNNVCECARNTTGLNDVQEGFKDWMSPGSRRLGLSKAQGFLLSPLALSDGPASAAGIPLRSRSHLPGAGQAENCQLGTI